MHFPPNLSNSSIFINLALHWVTVAILILFAMELLLVIFAYGLHIFRKPFYLIDIVVVTGSLIFDIVLWTLQQNYDYDFIAGFVLLLSRGWRVVRIVHGVIVGIEEKTKENKKRLEDSIKTLKKQNEELSEIIKKQNETMQGYKDELDSIHRKIN